MSRKEFAVAYIHTHVFNARAFLLRLGRRRGLVAVARLRARSHEAIALLRAAGVADSKSTRNRLVNSRNVTSDHAKLLGQLRHTKPGIVEHWTEYADRDVFERMAQHWRDPKNKNAKAAIDSFPDDELRKASRKTVERIFGTRTVNR